MSGGLQKIDALVGRYAALIKALAPEISGFALAGAALQRPVAWGEVPDTLESILAAAGWAAASPDRHAVVQQQGLAGVRLVALPLVSDSGRLLGAAALVWPEAGELDGDTLRRRVEPALECLRQEVSAADAAQCASELQWQQAVTQLHRDHLETDALDILLRASLGRNGCQAAMLYVPNRGIALEVQAADSWSPDVAAEFDGLRGRLRGLAGQLRRSLVLNGPSRKPGHSSACRLLIVPALCCGGRVEVLVAFLNPLTGPTFGPQQVMLLQSAALAAARRLDLDLDPQTGLLNRSGLGQVLSHLGPGAGSLVLVDIDNHHALNQTHGIATGDLAIERVAALLAPPLLPKRCYAARLQGGRFALIAAGLDTKAAKALAEAVQQGIAAIDLGDGKTRIGFTASCGITGLRSLAAPLQQAIIPAEAALRAAKTRGRPGIEESSQDRTVFEERRDHKLMAAGLREVLRNAEIILFAQKIVSTYDTQKTTGYELLVRMKDPFTGRILEPAEFLAAAQAYNLLSSVDRHVVEAAFEILGRHRQLLAQVEVRISINISGSSLGDPTFADFFIERLRASRVPPAQVSIDVTEKAAMVNFAVVADTLQKLRAEGCGIAIDDFGPSGNALARLRSMPVTHIKIDSSFVNEVLTNPLAESAVRGIVNFARDLNVDCVAECVETAPVLNRLRQLGVQHVQGYLVGRPAPIEEALAAMERTRMAEMAVFLHL